MFKFFYWIVHSHFIYDFIKEKVVVFFASPDTFCEGILQENVIILTARKGNSWLSLFDIHCHVNGFFVVVWLPQFKIKKLIGLLAATHPFRIENLLNWRSFIWWKWKHFLNHFACFIGHFLFIDIELQFVTSLSILFFSVFLVIFGERIPLVEQLI